MSRPNLFELPVWENFEQCVVELFAQALKALANKTELPLQEDFLSRELLTCCRKANHRLRKEGRGVESFLFQLTNQPLADDAYRARRLEKRPDFTCGFHDDSLPEEEFEEADYLYTIECKRLGAPRSPSWVFNRNYVEHGIKRFADPNWGYAKRCRSAMMVGFIQTMHPNDVLVEVNSHVSPFPSIAMPSEGWTLNGLSILRPHRIQRLIPPDEFTLNHLWVDLRRCRFYEVPARGVARSPRRRR